MQWIRIAPRIALILFVATQLSGCFLTKVVSVPMRVGGAVLSIIPVAGNTIDAAIDTAADVVDEAPI